MGKIYKISHSLDKLQMASDYLKNMLNLINSEINVQ